MGDYGDYVGDVSYVTIYVNQWLEMINEKLNPFFEEITLDNVSILTRGSDRLLFVTDGNKRGDASWGSGSRGPDPNGSGGNNSSNSSGNQTNQSPAPDTTSTNSTDLPVTGTDPPIESPDDTETPPGTGPPEEDITQPPESPPESAAPSEGDPLLN